MRSLPPLIAPPAWLRQGPLPLLETDSAQIPKAREETPSAAIREFLDAHQALAARLGISRQAGVSARIACDHPDWPFGGPSNGNALMRKSSVWKRAFQTRISYESGGQRLFEEPNAPPAAPPPQAAPSWP